MILFVAKIVTALLGVTPKADTNIRLLFYFAEMCTFVPLELAEPLDNA